jgi:protein-tyrosine phosphatase
LFHELENANSDTLPPPPFGGTLVSPPDSALSIILGGVSEAMYPQALRERNVVAIINVAGRQCRDFQRMDKVMTGDSTIVSQWDRIQFTQGWYQGELGNPNFRYLIIDAEDHPRYKIGEHFLECIDFIREIELMHAHGERATILVHCIQGLNRSAAIVAAYLLATTNDSLETIVDRLSKERRNILSNRNFLSELIKFEDSLRRGAIVEDISVPPPSNQHVFSIGNIIERHIP